MAVRRNALALAGVALLVLCASAFLLVWNHAREVRALTAASTYHLPSALALLRIEAEAVAVARAGSGAVGRLDASMAEVRRLQGAHGQADYGPAVARLEAAWQPVLALEAGAAPAGALEPFLAAVADLRARHLADGERLAAGAAGLRGPWSPTLGIPLVFLLGLGALVGQRLVVRISRAALRQQAVERALRRTGAGHARAEAIAHMGHWSWDARTAHSRRSAEVYRILGRSPDSLDDGMEGFFAVVHPDDLDRVRGLVSEALAAGTSYRAEFRILRPDGAERWVESHAEISVDPETGKAARMVGTFADITERVRAEEALRASEQRFHQIFDHAPVGIGLGDPEGWIIDANAAFRAMVGYSAEELRGKRFADFTHPDDMALYLAFLEKAQAGAEGTIDKRYIRKDGSIAWGRLTLRFVPAADGQAAYGIGMVEDITHRKTMEEALAESEERLRQVTESIDQVFWVTDVEKQELCYVSPAYEAVYGERVEAAYQNPGSWMAMVHPDDIGGVRADLAEARRTGEPYSGVYRIIRPDGSRRVIHGRGYPVRDAEGRVYRWAGVSADVTELHRLETALRESEERLRQVTENIGEVFWMNDPGYEHTFYISPAYEAIWDRSRESLFRDPKSWLASVHPDDRDLVDRGISAARAAGVPYEHTYRIVRPDGTERVIRSRGYPVRDDGGTIYRWAGVSSDITKVHRLQTALREQEERTRLILDSTAEAIYGVDLEGRCTFANASCLRLLGYDAEAHLLGRDMHALLRHGHPDGVPCPGDGCAVRAAIRHGRRYHAEDGRVLRASGPPLPVDCWAHPLHRDGELVGAVVTFVDATARNRAEVERRHYQDELARVARLATVGEMASGVAHQINQPLAAISAFAQGSIQRLGQRGGEEAAGVVESLEQISRQAARAGDILRHLRELVGKGSDRRVPEDINALVASAAHLMEPEAHRNGVTLLLDLGADLPKVSVDRIGVDQVLINLMKNAIEALADGGSQRKLTLSTRRAGAAAVAVTVADNGPGLSPAVAERLFHPFFTTKPDGLGLGLAISRSIIEGHAGELTAVPSRPRGAAFRFTFPVREHV